MEPRTTQAAWRRWRQPPAPKLTGAEEKDTKGRRWRAYTPDPYWTEPPEDPLVLYVCYLGKTSTFANREFPRLGEEVKLQGGKILHLYCERSDARRCRHAVYEVQIVSINEEKKSLE